MTFGGEELPLQTLGTGWSFIGRAMSRMDAMLQLDGMTDQATSGDIVRLCSTAGQLLVRPRLPTLQTYAASETPPGGPPISVSGFPMWPVGPGNPSASP